MPVINVQEFSDLIKNKRKELLPSPFDLVYESLQDVNGTYKDEEYFSQNASEMVERLRDKCWSKFTTIESEFTRDMLKSLIDPSELQGKTAEESIVWYCENFAQHIYTLSLSNTQSRRSRAGKEFEAIIEIVLRGSGISLDSQGNIGKHKFENKGLGKLVDFVLPSVAHYGINKRNTVLISAKTTLRERWQEVPEEIGRTGAREMFLATLDGNISDEVLRTLSEANIIIVTTKGLKESKYMSKNEVIAFESLIKICKDNQEQWNSYEYTIDQIDDIKQSLNDEISKSKGYPFIEKLLSKNK